MPEINLSKLPQRLRQMRVLRGLTQVEVAQRIGVNKSTITRWESGKGVSRINHAEMSALADIYNVSPSYLLGWIDEPMTQEAETVERALNDVGKLYKDILGHPLKGQDPQNNLLNHKILAQVMHINETCLSTPGISAHVAEQEAHIAMKYLLQYYNIPWQEYSDGLLYKLLNSQLMRNFIHDSLSLLQQAGQKIG